MEPGSSDGGRSARERTILLTLAAVQFTSIVDFMVVMPLGSRLMRELHVGPDRFGWIVSSYTFAAAAAGLVAATVVDRVGRRRAFLSLYVGFLVGTLLCGLAPGFWTLLAARVVTGAFGGILGGLAMAIVGDVFPEERRGRATGALMSAFALASVVGVPFGLFLGTRLGWHAPFLFLVGLGLPILFVGARAMPPLRGHLDGAHGPPSRPLRQLAETFSDPNHLNAFALVVSMMLGGFAVIAYLSPYLVANVGVPEDRLFWVYVVGGALTLFSSPAIGRLADRFGKLRVYRVIAPLSAVLMLIATHLPRVPLGVAVAVFALLMVCNSGRMIAAMAMITGSVEPRRRGGFLSANSAVQHVATGVGAWLGGQMLAEGADHALVHFDRVGWVAAGFTMLSLYLAGRLRPATPAPATTAAFAVAAAAEATLDADNPLAADPA
jgi:predicted MFS family arabinose efflux permease